MMYFSDQAVFVDESLFDQQTEHHGEGWLLSGKAATCKAFFIQGKQYILQLFVSHFT